MIGTDASAPVAREIIAAGYGSLEVVRRGPRSIVTRAIAASPLRLLTPRNHGGAAWVYAATYGGGLVDGDALRLGVSVGPQAMAMLSTQASTKVYRSTRGSSLELTAAVAPRGLLVMLPDPTVCFAASTYRQTQRIDLDTGAGLVLVDWLTSGRRDAGERWRFDGYSSRLAVYQDGRLVMLDALSLGPAEGSLERRMGRFNVLCLIALVGQPVRANATYALARTASVPVVKGARVIVGASAVGEGDCLIRIAGVSFEEVAATAREYLRFVPPLLGDDPWARKW